MCKCCGSIVLFSVFMWAIFGFIGAVIFMVLSAKEENTDTFWEVFAFNFVLGLIQAWFLIDLIKMGCQFRASWKDSHPPPRPDDEEEVRVNAKKHLCLKNLFCFCCFPIWILWQCCCTKRKKTDPYDDGQDDFGVKYEEYEKWKNGEELGARKLPKKYQNAFPDIAGGLNSAVNVQVDKVNQKVDKTKQGVVKTYEANVAGIKKSGNKWKQKANKMGMQMKLNKKRVHDEDVATI